jgi:hypothetical protein
MDAFLNRLERRIGWLAVPHLTWLLVALQLTGFVLNLTERYELLERFEFLPARVVSGEAYRIFTFLAIPFHGLIWQIVFIVFLFYACNVVETGLGRFRYTLYVLLVWVITVSSTLILQVAGVDTVYVSNWFIYESLMLALAAIAPNDQIYVGFIIPVKQKWLGLLVALLMLAQILLGISIALWGNVTAGVAVFAVYLAYFGRYHYEFLKQAKRRAAFRGKQLAVNLKALHRCAVCDRSEKSNPELEFRVCSTCTKGQEYCQDHIRDHSHQ